MSEQAPGPEVYCASLFAKCDPQDTGEVKVSQILETLKNLQDHATDLEESDKECSDQLLQEVKRMFDPFESDPLITLAVFTEGITSFLEREQLRLASDTQDASNISSFCSRYGRLSDSFTSDSVVEGSGEPPPAGHGESENFNEKTADMELQIQKLSEDVINLRESLNATLEENSSLLLVQRDDHEKQKREQSTFTENIQRLEFSVHEKDFVIATLEEKNLQLTDKLTISANEISNLQEQLKEAITEIEDLKSEVKKLTELLASRDEKLVNIKAEQVSSLSEWKTREQDLFDQIASLRDIVTKLQEDCESLKLEKLDLETTVATLNAEVEKNRRGISTPEAESTLNSPLNFTSSSIADIESEIRAAGDGTYTSSPFLGRHLLTTESFEKFDAATQCDKSMFPEQCISTSQVIFKNVKRGFQILFILFVTICILLLLSSGYLPDISVRCIPSSYFKNVEHFFKLCGNLDHDFVPII